ncbi:UNVERIFIED_CONTAM: hypothetical protein NCL1_57932 [Trichonephila clavipes]
MTHRLGAVALSLALLVLAWRLRAAGLGRLAGLLLLALAVQISLGVSNVVLHLPLAVAVAHNAGGATLLLVLVLINYRLRERALLANLRSWAIREQSSLLQPSSLSANKKEKLHGNCAASPLRICQLARLPGADQAQGGAADADHLAGRHVSRHPRRGALDGAAVRQPRHWPVRRRGGGGQPCGRPAYRLDHGAYSQTPGDHRPRLGAGGAGLRPAPGGSRHGVAAGLHQRAGRLADPGLAARLRGALYRLSQARHAAEYRHRRSGRRRAAAARLGGGDRAYQRRAAVAGADHLRLDAAALLGPGHSPQGRVCQGRHPHAAGHPRRALHQGAYPAVHRRDAGGDPAALCHPHERAALSGGGAGTRRAVFMRPVDTWARSIQHLPARSKA